MMSEDDMPKVPRDKDASGVWRLVVIGVCIIAWAVLSFSMIASTGAK
jgi:hypothetical protein